MLKRKLGAAIVAATLLACTAIVPAFADGLSLHETLAQDTMKTDKMGQDKMTGDKMAGDKMSGHKMSRRRRHQRHKKHMAGTRMGKMQGNPKM
ncbi:MAG: hypothetical protein ABI967_14825 [bacterium]